MSPPTNTPCSGKITCPNQQQMDRAVDEMLEKYCCDLNFILDFQRCKAGKLAQELYLCSFQAFLSDFRVLRWIGKSNVQKLLSVTISWVHGATPNDVDMFASHLMTHFGKNYLSLASKVLMLNAPWAVSPIDNCVKKALGLPSGNTGNNYATFAPCFNAFKQQCQQQIQQCIQQVTSHQHIKQAEQNFSQGLQQLGITPNIAAIRENRMADKLLWAIGKSMGC